MSIFVQSNDFHKFINALGTPENYEKAKKLDDPLHTDVDSTTFEFGGQNYNIPTNKVDQIKPTLQRIQQAAEQAIKDRKAQEASDLGQINFDAPQAKKSNRGWKVLAGLSGVALAVSLLAAAVLVAAVVLLSAPISAPILIGAGIGIGVGIMASASVLALSAAKA